MWIRLVVLILGQALALAETDKQLHDRILNGYNRKIRPVKLESSITQVTVFLNIAHVEKVDEEEQTALIHGHLWASWTDEYLQWDRKKNNITKVTISSNRIWQPALALYNSARGNSWHLYMNGMPSTVYANGKVWSSGTFSFFVTCQFDFHDWPFDEQSCPIVIADWVYGLAQVNLSDPNNMAEYAKPSIRMSYDPISTQNKRHVGGWEVKDSWKKHCYWGPQGCKDSQPEGEPDWYWSILEFGITLKRHLPYYYLTHLLPTVFSAVFLLYIFWIDDDTRATICIMTNFAIQAIYGLTLFRQMPPGSGSIPKIVKVYMLTGYMSTFQMVLVTYIGYLEFKLPRDHEFNLGFDITAIPKRLGIETYFKKVEMSFDPQAILSQVVPETSEDDSPLVALDSAHNDGEVLINLPSNSEPEINLDEIQHIGMEDAQPTVNPEEEEDSKAVNQLHHIKRYCFIIALIIYILTIFYCMLF